jgi:hypothetical protein
MTEVEWDSAQDPESMLAALDDKVTPRKWRLFACGCCRRVWSLLREKIMRESVELAEDYADGLASDEELAAGCQDALGMWSSWPRMDRAIFKAFAAVTWVVKPNADWDVATNALECCLQAECRMQPDEAKQDRCELIRDVFGNPFRGNPRVLATSDAGLERLRLLAESIYDDPERLDTLPGLADALVAAGCQDEEILRHCRVTGSHVRGCWVLDLLLGKK